MITCLPVVQNATSTTARLHGGFKALGVDALARTDIRKMTVAVESFTQEVVDIVPAASTSRAEHQERRPYNAALVLALQPYQ
ncbi:hypothetical protein V8E36_004155 [Tilletia maclaganii]